MKDQNLRTIKPLHLILKSDQYILSYCNLEVMTEKNIEESLCINKTAHFMNSNYYLKNNTENYQIRS